MLIEKSQDTHTPTQKKVVFTSPTQFRLSTARGRYVILFCTYPGSRRKLPSTAHVIPVSRWLLSLAPGFPPLLTVIYPREQTFFGKAIKTSSCPTPSQSLDLEFVLRRYWRLAGWLAKFKFHCPYLNLSGFFFSVFNDSPLQPGASSSDLFGEVNLPFVC